MAGAAAELAATRKDYKYVDLGARYIFELIAIETEFSTHQRSYPTLYCVVNF